MSHNIYTCPSNSSTVTVDRPDNKQAWPSNHITVKISRPTVACQTLLKYTQLASSKFGLFLRFMKAGSTHYILLRDRIDPSASIHQSRRRPSSYISISRLIDRLGQLRSSQRDYPGYEMGLLRIKIYSRKHAWRIECRHEADLTQKPLEMSKCQQSLSVKFD